MAARGQAVLRLINAGDEATWFTLPELHGRTWTPRIDTCTHSGFPPDERPLEGGYRAAARSIVLLTQPVPA